MYYSIAFALIFVSAAVSAVGGSVYLTWNLSWPAVIITTIISLAASAVLLRHILSRPAPLLGDKEPGERAEGPRPWIAAILPFGALIGICFMMLARGAASESLNTPWSQVSPLFWIALASAAGIGTALLLRAGRLTSWLVSLGLLGAGLSVAGIVYSVGYGYDPFVHEAAEIHILNFGSIAPKTPYYAGQYALAVVLARLTGISLHSIGVWLLPAMSAVGIVGAVGVTAKAEGWKTGTLMAGIIAILPLSAFINTTPFGLAALYCLLAAICALGAEKEPRLKVAVWAFAIASLLTHPIAGVPALVLAAVIQFRNRFVRLGLGLGGALVLPVLFALAGGKLSFDWGRLGMLALPFELPLTRFRPLGDSLYAVAIVAAVIAAIGALRRYPYLIAAASSALSGILVAVMIDFSYLPDSEQGGYASRLLTVALLIAVPAGAALAARLLERAAGRGWRTLAAVAACVFLFVGGVYLAYPREDPYVISKGWSTSATDISAVRAIDGDAKGEPYIVLAAQPISAAALKEFGFFRYFDTAQGQMFAYPVPTGGPLYQYYLKMIYDEPSSEYMKQAMEMAGVKLGYFVVNSYWTRADHIISRAKISSERWFGIDNADYVFRYQR